VMGSELPNVPLFTISQPTLLVAWLLARREGKQRKAALPQDANEEDEPNRKQNEGGGRREG